MDERERELSKLAVAGDDEAFLAILQLHKETLLRTALAFLKNEHAAIEALQEVTYRAYKKIHTVKEPAFLKTWLTKIMINYCQDQIKKNQRYISNERLKEPTALDNYALLEIQDILSHLSKEEQQLIYLKYFQDLKIKEIATLEKVPEGTIKSRLHKTLNILRGYFKEKGERDYV